VVTRLPSVQSPGLQLPVRGAIDARYVTMLKETLAVVDKGIKAGKTLDQLKQENVLAPWQKWNGDFITTEQWLITLYNDLTGKKPSEFIKHN
jgi:hypothetical protein